MVDVLIIGAGPVGLACGIEAQKNGLSVRIVEKGALVNSLVGYPTNMEFFSTPELMEIGGYPFPTIGYKPTREEGIEYYRRVAQTEGLDVRLYERVVRIEGEDGDFVVETDRDRHRCRKVIVSTGFFDVPNRLGVPGEDLSKVKHYYKEPYPYTAQRVAVVGAKNSAAKAALALYRHGADVTLLVRGPELSPSIKYWIRPDLENRIKEGSIAAHFGTVVTAIHPDAVDIEAAGGAQTIGNDFVLALIGYRPDYSFLETLGVASGDDPFRTPLYDESTFESSRSGVYLAGTICGGLKTSRWFIENGRFHARQIVRHILEKPVVPFDADEIHWKTAE